LFKDSGGRLSVARQKPYEQREKTILDEGDFLSEVELFVSCC
jgi:hypothetical protein